jgi:hypothetical protein
LAGLSWRVCAAICPLLAKLALLPNPATGFFVLSEDTDSCVDEAALALSTAVTRRIGNGSGTQALFASPPFVF